MPGGNISTIDRIERLKEIKRLKDEEGLSANKIAEETGIALTTVQRNLKYLEEISISDLTPEDRAKKRLEIELEFKTIAAAAKEQFEEWQMVKPATARNYLLLWKDTISEIAKIYGLENVKVDSFTQINQLNQYEVPDKIDMRTGEKIAEAIKKQHEEGL